MKYQQVAMMTHLRIELPQMSKQDNAATQAAEAAFGASGAGQYRKQLYPKHLVDPIHAAVAATRAYRYGQTRKIGCNEDRIVPNCRIMTYLDMMGRHELAFWQTVTAFLNNWSNVLIQAQQQQGGLFNRGEYPQLDNLRNQFVFEYPITPIGNVADIVLNELDDASHSIIVEKAMSDERKANETLVKDAVADLRAEVLRILRQTTVVQTTNKKGERIEKSGKIYDTLTQDIGELIGVLRDLNAAEGNPALQDVLAQADMHLTIPADALRNDLEVCRITKDRAEAILKSMEAFS